MGDYLSTDDVPCPDLTNSMDDLLQRLTTPDRSLEMDGSDLRDALDALLAGKPVPKPRGKCIGCFIPKLK